MINSQTISINDIRSEIATILPLINQHRPLVYRSLRQIAKQQGWYENIDRGKGSHRSFQRKGYASIPVKCHGEGKEIDAPVVRLILQRLYQPTVDQMLGSTMLEPAVLQKIDDLLDCFSQSAAIIEREEILIYQKIREQAQEELERIQRRINHLLDQEVETANILLVQDAQEQRAIAQATRVDLEQAHQKIEQLQQELEQQQDITHQKQAQLTRFSMELVQMQRQMDDLTMCEQSRQLELQRLQDQNHSLEQDLSQLITTQKCFTLALQVEQEKKQQLLYDVDRFKKYQRRKEWSLWVCLFFGAILAIAGVRMIETPLECSSLLSFYLSSPPIAQAPI